MHFVKHRALVFYETLKALANDPNMDVITEEKTSKYAPMRKGNVIHQNITNDVQIYP